MIQVLAWLTSACVVMAPISESRGSWKLSIPVSQRLPSRRGRSVLIENFPPYFFRAAIAVAAGEGFLRSCGKISGISDIFFRRPTLFSPYATCVPFPAYTCEALSGAASVIETAAVPSCLVKPQAAGACGTTVGGASQSP